MTQRDRVLAALRRAQPQGISQVDFLLPGVVDGGAPITRLAARIEELRAAGHQIIHAGHHSKCVVYTLVHDAEIGSGPISATGAPEATTTASLSAGTLFELESPEPEQPAPVNAALADWDIAA